ncbi:MAG: thioesterase family protein [Deltaproteobacteria bacterium]|nr:thioesterase family protein [Deltaproteobacteria bacterium]
MDPADLARDTAVTRLTVAPGWYTAELSSAWDFRTPSGGALMTVAMRAMQQELGDPDLRPLSANTHFCSPVPAGPLEVRVEVLRHGGVAAQVRAALSSTTMPGPGLEVSATFARHRDGIDVIDTTPPAVPPPDACPSFDQVPIIVGRERPRFFANLESRLAFGHPWWEPGWQAGAARIGRWFRYRVPQHLPDGRFDPLALPPLADTMPPALIQKLGPDHEPFFAPSLDLTVHFLEDTTAEWMLTSVHARRARAGYATADVEIWDDRGTLVAYATQMMLLRRVPDRTVPHL